MRGLLYCCIVVLLYCLQPATCTELIAKHVWNNVGFEMRVYQSRPMASEGHPKPQCFREHPALCLVSRLARDSLLVIPESEHQNGWAR